MKYDTLSEKKIIRINLEQPQEKLSSEVIMMKKVLIYIYNF
jgi:hypothetical protein